MYTSTITMKTQKHAINYDQQWSMDMVLKRNENETKMLQTSLLQIKWINIEYMDT